MPAAKHSHRPRRSHESPYELTVFLKPSDLRTSDELAADWYLAGGAQQCAPEKPLVKRAYLLGEAARLGREALVRILRGDRPLPRTLRKRLADLFDENSNSDRKLEIGFRGEGRRLNPLGDAQVARYVARKSKELNSSTRAIEAAAIFFKRDETTISKMVRRHNGK